MRLDKRFQFLFICLTLEVLDRNLEQTQKHRTYISWFDDLYKEDKVQYESIMAP